MNLLCEKNLKKTCDYFLIKNDMLYIYYNYNIMKELDKDLKDLLKNINLCCIKINEQKNLNCTFNKIDFLEKESFYDDFPNTKFHYKVN